ncbi:unnamed protein product [Pseudo-nitzschia multistriata]|uniref:Ubiquitin-like domain-containing protein n=1 Tax=Pseudo-nitzschia multistriata TaxID=183589 RepID=A0A448ZI87_9STRA|nr:unnamed protein product [Pseudo-nitzschia multistriata]
MNDSKYMKPVGERTSRGKTTAEAKGLEWTKNVPVTKEYEFVRRDDSHMAKNETGFLEIGKADPTYAYDVGGTWKLLYRKPDEKPIGPGIKPKNEQPMKIFVRSWNDEIFPLDNVKPQDSIDEIRFRLEEEHCIPREQQRLRLGSGQPLVKDRKSLEEYGIKDEDILDLEPMSITVRLLGGQTVHLEVEPQDAIKDIKWLVGNKLDIPIDDCILLFKDKSLPETSTLDENDIHHGDVIDLQQMEIYVIDLDGQKLEYLVSPSDTIESIKNVLEEDTGLKREDQRLCFQDNLLKNDKMTLKDAGIKHQDTLALEPMQVTVRSTTGGTVDLLVEPDQNIEDIKWLVEQNLNIPIEDQHLSVRGCSIPHNTSLRENNIYHGDVIDLLPTKIYVIDLDGQQWTYPVNLEDTVKSIKDRLSYDTRINRKNQRLSFKGKLLEKDMSTLRNNGIQNEDALHLEPMQIKVIAPDGDVYELVVSPDDTIQEIKELVQEQLGVPVEDQTPTFRGNPLPENSTLEENNIDHGDSIDLQPTVIHVIDLDRKKWSYSVNLGLDNIRSLKNQLKIDTGVIPKLQRLVFNGNLLKNDKSSLKNAGIKHEDILRLEPMQITVRTNDGRIVDLAVDPDDTIESIKKQVEEYLSIPIEYQLPEFHGSLLNDNSTLEENGIYHGDVIDLGPMEIYVIDLNDLNWTYMVDPFVMVSSIKSKVERDIKVSRKHQRLSFQGRLLENDEITLKDVGIRHRDTLKLEPMRIKVIAPDESITDLAVDPNDTILDVKDQIQDKLGIPIEDQLPVFGESPLCDKSTLEENGICHGDAIDLKPMEIYVIDLDGNKRTYIVEPTDTVNSVKMKLEDETGVKRKEQRLSFQGKVLKKGKRTLKDAGIRHKDTLRLENVNIIVRAPDGRTVNLLVDPDNTVEDIKEKVQNQLRIPIEDQRPTFKDSLLPDNSTLADNNIGHGDVVDLQPMEIYVIDMDGRQHTYTVDLSDFIKDVKDRVADGTGVKPRQQRLFFEETLLDDDRNTLQNAGIKHQDTLRLEPFEISVRFPLGEKTIVIQVDPETTTANDLKRIIQDREGIAPGDQTLSFGGQKLEKPNPLGDFDVKHGDIIDLRLPPPPKIKKSYLTPEWKEKQKDRYGNLKVTTYKLDYNGEPGDSLVAEVNVDSSDFKFQSPQLKSQMKF